YSDEEERQAPRRHDAEDWQVHRWNSRSRLYDSATNEKREARADEDAHRIDAQRARQPLFRKIVWDQGEGSWSERRFAHAYTHSGQEQRAEASGACTQGRHHAPEQHANRD